MRSEDLKIGHVYGNDKGMYRKIRRFTNTSGKEISYPYNIHYVRCTETGAVSTKAKEQSCWVSTFISWSKETLGPVGNIQQDE